jgi:hypothetical protein
MTRLAKAPKVKGSASRRIYGKRMSLPGSLPEGAPGRNQKENATCQEK